MSDKAVVMPIENVVLCRCVSPSLDPENGNEKTYQSSLELSQGIVMARGKRRFVCLRDVCL